MEKKGTARVVKKPSKTNHSSSEDEDATSDYEEKVLSKLKGKGKGNVAAASDKGKAAANSTGPAKTKKWKADMAAEAMPIHEDDDVDFDATAGEAHNDALIDMQFDEAA